MKSYSLNVTPITTYIADKNASVRKNKLNELAKKTGVSAEELMKLPSSGSTDAMLVQNAIYKEIKSNDSVDNVNINTVKAYFDTLKNIANQNTDKNSTELSVLIEKEVVSNLVTANKITKVPLQDAKDMTEDEKNQYSLGVNGKDYVLSNTLVDFVPIKDANLSTDYESNEITFEGINVALSISINNNDFKIIKNGTELDTNNTTVENGDKIKLKLTTSGNFSETKNVTLTIEDKFTSVAKNKLDFASAQDLCSKQNLSLPTSYNLKSFYENNNKDFPIDKTKFWTSEPYSYGHVMFDIEKKDNQYYGRVAEYDNNQYNVICTKHYNDLHFSVTTKSDPNQAPVANAGVDQKVYYTEPVTLSASLSSDDNGIVSYEWVTHERISSMIPCGQNDYYSSGTPYIFYSDTDPEMSNEVGFGDVWLKSDGTAKQQACGTFGWRDLYAGTYTYQDYANQLQILSSDETFTKTDFSVGTHNIILKVTDDGGKTTTDNVVVTIFDTFTNLLPMQDAGGIKSISSSTINGSTTTTLASGSSSFFKITNDTKRTFTITKFEIKTTYNGSSTIRASSSNIASVLGSDKLLPGKTVTLGHTLQSSETANYWTGIYYLTDDATGTTFTNSATWNGTTFY